MATGYPQTFDINKLPIECHSQSYLTAVRDKEDNGLF